MTTSTTGGDPAVADEKAAFVREAMRKSWGARVQAYVDEAAPNTAAHTTVLLQELPPHPGARILDVATGPGTVALAAAMIAGPTSQVIATDLAPEWAPIIDTRAKEFDIQNVTFRAMGAEELDLPDASFDLAYCQFGLMFLPDPGKALRELRRVLRPGGQLGVVVWSTPDKVPCFTAMNKHLNPHIPPEAPERQLPTPLQLGAPGLIESLVSGAGFSEVRVTRHTIDFVGNSPEDMWHLRVVNGPPAARAAIQSFDPAERERVRAAVFAELETYRRDGPDGSKLRLPSEAIYVIATA